MKSKSLILIVIACGCGLVASIGISQVMDRGGGHAAADTVKILVTLNDININDKLDAQNVKLEDWPKDRVPEGALSKLEDVKDQYTRTRFFKGEPVLKAKLSATFGGSTTPIPEGYRVVPISVDKGVVTELIQPGDRVDIVVFVHKNAEIPTTNAMTVLTDVRIWAVNEKTERAKEKETEALQARTVSVLVKPDQVERIMLAMELGKIRISLRRPDDKHVVENKNGTSVADLFRGGQSATDPIAPATNNLSDFLRKKTAETEVEAPTPAPVTHVPVKKMVVHTPDGIKLYVWNHENELPEMISLSEGGATAPAPSIPSTASGAGVGKNSGTTPTSPDDNN